jgi:hypothetical protein
MAEETQTTPPDDPQAPAPADPAPTDPAPADPAPDATKKGGPDAALAAADYREQRDRARAELADLQKRIAELEGKPSEIEGLKAQLETEREARALEAAELEGKRVNTVRLTQAGCIDIDVALGLLNEHGDVDKLKEEKPYLFGAKQVGSTGVNPSGPPDTQDELLAPHPRG